MTNQNANGQQGTVYQYGHCDCLWVYSSGSPEFICNAALSQNNICYYHSGHFIYFNWCYYSNNKSDSKYRGMTGEKVAGNPKYDQRLILPMIGKHSIEDTLIYCCKGLEYNSNKSLRKEELF